MSSELSRYKRESLDVTESMHDSEWYKASDVDAHLATLHAELEGLRAEVREWLCESCNTVYQGPPGQGTCCVQCPQCQAVCGPRLTVERRRLTQQLAAANDYGTRLTEILQLTNHLDTGDGPNTAFALAKKAVEQLAELQQERAAIEQAISVEFAKKAYTDEDRLHKDLLEDLGTFLDHHQELEQRLAAREGQIEKLKIQLVVLEQGEVLKKLAEND